MGHTTHLELIEIRMPLADFAAIRTSGISSFFIDFSRLFSTEIYVLNKSDEQQQM
jgi:hypothetical protein